MKIIPNSVKKMYLLHFVLLFSITNSFGQLQVPFKVRHQGYVKGDMALIANNIVNRVDASNDAIVPYNNRSAQGKLNDEFVMMYVDIDNDKSTFSSSSADLVLENQQNKKIVYAGLYWSATYLYNSGKSPDTNKFKAIDSKRDTFDNIKIKLPNQDNYTNIKGELIYDGIKDNAFKESAPYAMYSDITNLVKNNSTQFGTYTVANVKSTVGEISGGVAAGWTIFFVYEDDNMTGKFITSYDGFAGVTEKSMDIQFSGFQTLPEGNVNAKVACAALEGDLNLKGDQFLFKAQETTDFVQLSNVLHDKSNVFNSSITIDNEFFNARFPNSKNTLGYDTFLMTIDNPNNSIIGNNTHDATLRLKTYGDRYFVFFNAFDVEVIKPEEINKPVELITSVEKVATPIIKPEIKTEVKKDVAVVTAPVKEKPVTPIVPVINKKPEVVVASPSKAIAESKVEKPKEIVQPKNTIVETKVEKPKEIVPPKEVIVAKIEKPKTTEVVSLVKNDIVTVSKPEISTKIIDEKPKRSTLATVNNTKPRIKPIESPAVMISSLKEGYYIIVNVFAVPSNATRFVSKLRKQGMFADYFINPLNNYRYVYVSKHDNFSDAETLYNSNINGQYYSDLWIMTVNKQNNSSYALTNFNNSTNNSDNNKGNNIETNIAFITPIDRRKSKVS